MKNGRTRFEHYLEQLEKLLADAAAQKDPAFWLYQNNARTPIFMLEGLAKLYAGIHNKKRFGKIGSQFKVLEDALGAIDYFDGFAKLFSQDKKVRSQITSSVQAKSLEKAGLLNDILRAKEWLGNGSKRIRRIRKRLDGADWLKDKADIKAIERYYERSIAKINDFAGKYQNGFTELESQVHELRRKLRWLSIYPQALQGCIQLTTDSTNDPNLAKYLTPEIVNSPFNKMPLVGDNRYVLILNRDYFLSLSWVISELGKLKDEGLKFVVMADADDKVPRAASDETAILSKASDMCRTFFMERNLDKMLGPVISAPFNEKPPPSR